MDKNKKKDALLWAIAKASGNVAVFAVKVAIVAFAAGTGVSIARDIHDRKSIK